MRVGARQRLQRSTKFEAASISSWLLVPRGYWGNEACRAAYQTPVGWKQPTAAAMKQEETIRTL